jgi:DNA repair exonuclease SbcCD ATPase subunit
MITLKELKWSNCFSYGADNTLKLDENTITQIVGLNGSGKSSIPLIIEEVLFSKNSKGVKKADIPNRNTGDDSYSISLSFDVGDNEYNLSIARKATLKVKLLENGVDISSHTATNTYKTASDLLGMDFKTMSQLFYQNTNASLQFLTATDTNRKKFLIDLLHLENYVELFEIFKDAVKECATVVTVQDTKVNTIQKWLDTNKLEATDILPTQEIHLDTSEDEILLGRLSSEIKNISEKNKKISINNDNKKLLAALDIEEISALPDYKINSYDKEMSKLGEYKGKVKTLEASIAKMEKLGDECPVCSQSIDPEFKKSMLDADRVDIDQLQHNIHILEEIIADIKLENSKALDKQTRQKEWEDLYRSIDRNLPNELLDKKEYETKITDLKASIADTKAKIAEIQAYNETVTKANTRIQVIQEQTDKFMQDLAVASQLLDAESAKLSKLETLKKAFSTNGLIAYKIENLVKELEELTNNYLAELSDGRFTIEFVVSNDKLNVEVTDFGKTVDILALSSGELARVNTATLLALRKLMNSISKSKLNVLFLDEVINVLDEQGKEKLVEVLLNEDLNTFIVSHNWTHPLLAKLEIIKDKNGVSYIER